MSDTASITGCSETGSFITNPAFRSVGPAGGGGGGVGQHKLSGCHDSMRSVTSDSELEQAGTGCAGAAVAMTAPLSMTAEDPQKAKVSYFLEPFLDLGFNQTNILLSLCCLISQLFASLMGNILKHTAIIVI